jgi:hypothetical protein
MTEVDLSHYMNGVLITNHKGESVAQLQYESILAEYDAKIKALTFPRNKEYDMTVKHTMQLPTFLINEVN